jgi:hypothetical protein
MLICSLAAGCYYDTQQELYGIQNSSCDTSGVKYTNIIESKSIASIIDANCNACHSQVTAQVYHSGALDNYNDLGVQADNGNLMGDITHNPSHNAMPPNASKLDQCTISKIQHWIDIGKPR